MTEIQLKYWDLQERKRANRVDEVERNRHNVATETISQGDLDEKVRHNMAGEMLTATQIQEQTRHNQATEGIDLAKHYETVRSNKAKEAETKRSNLAKEAETHRANVVKEKETHEFNAATVNLRQTEVSASVAKTASAIRLDEENRKLTASRTQAQDISNKINRANVKYREINAFTNMASPFIGAAQQAGQTAVKAYAALG